ncbi:hypothetical protein PMI31_01269 [Pseudomonas sp. GM55]|nr:hypothetical protein PMI31_01269 [Pseudomonas sp. GM55]
MLAMDVQATHFSRHPSFSFTPIASKLAPTKAMTAHLRSNIVYHCCKFLQCDSEEPCE